MTKIFNIVRANIRKAKGQTISFFFIVLISAMLLNLGLITAMNYDNNYDKRFDEANGAHAFISIKDKDYKEKYLDYMKNYDGVKEVEKRNVKSANGELSFDGSELPQEFIFYDISDNTTMANRNFIEKSEVEPEDAIYLPYVIKTAGGTSLGEKFNITIDGEKYTYTIAGFYEDFNTGRFSFQYIGLTLSHDSYENLIVDNKNIFYSNILFARMNNIKDSEKFFSDTQRYISSDNEDSNIDIKGFTCEQTKSNAMVIPTIMMMSIIAFSLIITIVSLIVIRFKISNGIEEDIQNIGALKAIGYTSKELIISFMVQFSGTALIASFLGMMVSAIVLPMLRIMLTTNSGVIWNQGIDTRAILITFIILIGVTSIVSLFSANKVRRLTPVIALNCGISANNFRKNIFPLDKTIGGLNILISMKTTLRNISQNIMITIIVMAITITSVVSIVLYHNMAVDRTKFENLISGEFSTIMLELGDSTYDESMKKELLEHDGIRKVSFYDLFGKGTLSNGHSIMIFLSEDFDDVENKKCYEGRDPKFDNEIVINGLLAERLDKEIGDTIEVSNGKYSYDYLVTGLMQSGNGGGYEAELNIQGYKRINPNYEMKKLNIYTDEGVDINRTISSLQNKFSKTFLHYSNMVESIESMSSTFSKVAVIMAIVIISVTALIIILIIYLSIKTSIIRQQREFGIKKALGFTTRQLMLQTALSFLPVVILGTILGGIVGFLGVNPLLSFMMKGMGIIKVNFTIPIIGIVILCIGISIFTFFIAMLMAGRIKKISAYKLINM